MFLARSGASALLYQPSNSGQFGSTGIVESDGLGKGIEPRFHQAHVQTADRATTCYSYHCLSAAGTTTPPPPPAAAAAAVVVFMVLTTASIMHTTMARSNASNTQQIPKSAIMLAASSGSNVHHHYISQYHPSRQGVAIMFLLVLGEISCDPGCRFPCEQPLVRLRMLSGCCFHASTFSSKRAKA